MNVSVPLLPEGAECRHHPAALRRSTRGHKTQQIWGLRRDKAPTQPRCCQDGLWQSGTWLCGFQTDTEQPCVDVQCVGNAPGAAQQKPHRMETPSLAWRQLLERNVPTLRDNAPTQGHAGPETMGLKPICFVTRI